MGINRHYLDLQTALSRKNAGVKCVFLSHQKADAAICRRIADYLTKADIDVYFDEYDRDLKYSRQTNNPRGVVEAIKKGINQSSHMLCVFSPNTLHSQWVPWEVGYGYDKTNISALTLKGIADNQIPDFIKTVPIIRGTKTLNGYISSLAGMTETRMFASQKLFENTIGSHPLNNYLDWQL